MNKALLRVLLLALVLLNALAILQPVNVVHSWYPTEIPPLEVIEKEVYYIVDYTESIMQYFGNYYSIGCYSECPLVEALNVSFYAFYDNSIIKYDLIGEAKNITIYDNGTSTPITYFLYKNGVLIWANTSTDAQYQFRDDKGNWYWLNSAGVKFTYDGVVLRLVFDYNSGQDYDVVIIDTLIRPKQLLVQKHSGYVYVSYMDSTTPSALYELRGYTSRLLLRNPADLYTGAVFTLRAKFYTSLDLRNVTYLNATGLEPTMCLYPSGIEAVVSADQIFITLENDSVTTPLVLVYNNTVFFINNFVLVDSKYVFHDYRAYRIDNTPICYIQDIVNNGTVVGNKTVCTSFRLVKLDPPPKPPVREFNSLYASYEYSLSKGWVLTLAFSTDEGTLTFYTPLSDILFYGVRVVNITRIYEYDVLAMDHQVLNGIISTASFYYWVLTDNPQLFVFSREKGIELNVPVDTTQYTFTFEKGFTYLSCQDMMNTFNISDPSLIPSCWGISYANVTNPVSATIGDSCDPSTVKGDVIMCNPSFTMNIETHDIKVKKYQPPDWWNIPAWMGFISEVFTDVASFIVTSVEAIASTFISTLLNRDLWTMFFVFIVFAHVIIILHNPADLYPLYRELYDFTLKIFKTVYDVMVWIADAVAAIIEAINPL